MKLAKDDQPAITVQSALVALADSAELIGLLTEIAKFSGGDQALADLA